MRFVEGTFGQEVRVPTARGVGASQRITAAAKGEKGDVPDWRRFMSPDLGEASKCCHICAFPVSASRMVLFADEHARCQNLAHWCNHPVPASLSMCNHCNHDLGKSP